MPVTNSKFDPRNNGVYSDLISIGKFKNGIVNNKDAIEINSESLVDAVNVDIMNDGRIKTRKKYKKILSGDFSSLYSFKGVFYAMNSGSFGAVDIGNPSPSFTSLYNGFGYQKTYYCVVNDELYFSNGETSMKIIQPNKNINEFFLDYWNLSSPTSVPIVSSSIVGGSLRAGRYMLRFSHKYKNYETGAGDIKVIDLEAIKDLDGIEKDFYAIHINVNYPQLYTGAKVYMTTTNGSVFYYVGTITGTNTLVVANFSNLGHALEEDGTKVKFPECQQISYSNGRIYGCKDNYVFYTRVFDYRQYNTKNMLIFDSKINIFIALQKGLFVATENATYFLNGQDPKDFVKIKVLDYGAIPGTLYHDNINDQYGWLSKFGHIIADNSGSVTNVSKDNIELPKDYEYGSALFKRHSTIEQVIFSMNKKGKDDKNQSDEFKNY